MPALLNAAPTPSAHTLPFHHRPVLYFATPPAKGVVLADYADRFLRLYAQCCGRAVNEKTHGLNIATFRAFGSGAHLPLAIIPSDTVLAKVPVLAHAPVRLLIKALLSTLNTAYPLLPNEEIQDASVGLLEVDTAGCKAGCVVYTRQTNQLTINFILPKIFLDLATGLPHVEQQGGMASHGLPSLQAAALGDSSASGVMQGVATNLAFALPPPWGPVGAALLTSLFGLFGSVFGPSNSGDAIRDLIVAAITELENFILQLNVQAVEGDVQTFFSWCATQLSTVPGQNPLSATDWSQPVVDYIETTLLPIVESALSFAHGSLANDLEQIATETYLTTTTYVARPTDAALQVVLMNVTALISAYKLSILLHSQVASFYQPVNNTCTSAVADQKFQDHSFAVVTKITNLATFVMGTPPATPDPVEQKQLSYSLNVAAAAIAGPLSTSGTSDDFTYLTGLYGCGAPATFDPLAYAALYGWTAAVKRLALYRQMARLYTISAVAYYDTRQTVCRNYGSDTECTDYGSDGYGYTDPVNGINETKDSSHWTSGCCDQNGHTQDYQADVLADWQTNWNGVVNQLANDTSVPSWAQDIAMATQWAQGVSSLLSGMPPLPPANTATAFAGTETAPATSQWNSAVSVSYAFAYLGPNGPSTRSEWGATFNPQQTWKPTLRHLPTDPAGVLQLQIWRQFTFHDANGQPTLGLPTIVATLTGTPSDPYIDADPAQQAM
ncbi:MAG: hypothetical protein HY985_13670 [Magnetospirillum sp.]|nr:hypothetical protein [Magnetospirillum sp.]